MSDLPPGPGDPPPEGSDAHLEAQEAKVHAIQAEKTAQQQARIQDRALRRFKRTMTIGLLLLLGANMASWAAIRQISHREAQHAIERCTDPRASLAIRLQWERVSEVIKRTNLPVRDPDHLSQRDASRLFAASYDNALKEAGPSPGCLLGTGP